MSSLRARICSHITYHSAECRVSNQEMLAELKWNELDSFQSIERVQHFQKKSQFYKIVLFLLDIIHYYITIISFISFCQSFLRNKLTDEEKSPFARFYVILGMGTIVPECHKSQLLQLGTRLQLLAPFYLTTNPRASRSWCYWLFPDVSIVSWKYYREGAWGLLLQKKKLGDWIPSLLPTCCETQDPGRC